MCLPSVIAGQMEKLFWPSPGENGNSGELIEYRLQCKYRVKIVDVQIAHFTHPMYVITQ